MKKLVVKEARLFGVPHGQVKRKPVFVEKHGQPVIVGILMGNCKQIEALKLEKLRGQLAVEEAKYDQR